MTGCSTLEELNQKFTELTSSLKHKVVLRDGLVSGNEHLNDILVEVKSGISSLDVQLVLIRSELSRRKKALQSVEILKTEMQELQSKATYASENLPQRLPGQKRSTTDTSAEIPITGIPVTPKFRQKARTFLTPMSTCNSSASSVSPSEAPSVRQIKKRAPTLFVPTVDYITVQEFQSIPKYMKGRITYEQINGAVDEFNKAVTGKYRLMATPRTKQTDRIKNMIWDYKQQETKDTKVAEGHFDSKSIGLKAQKKLIGKLASKKIAKVFIDETSGRLLDNLHKCAKMYFEKKKAEKAMKHLIKTVIKIGILYRNDQLSAEEIRTAEDFKRKFRTVAMTVISFCEVDFTFDKGFLNKSLNECCAMLKQLVERHLQDKSLSRIDNVFSVFGNTDFLECMFQPRSQYRDYLGKIVQDLNSLLEQGVL